VEAAQQLLLGAGLVYVMQQLLLGAELVYVT
jgi:hypothetical protein